jgi:RimJ/RimL family protein N-acetyltransferase
MSAQLIRSSSTGEKGEQNMEKNIYTGRLVRLTAEEPEVMGEAFSRWNQNSEFWRLLSDDPTRLWSKKVTQGWVEKGVEKDDPGSVIFSVRSLEDERLIGFVALDGIQWSHGNAYVAIGIGEPRDWSKGYGSDAMRLVLRYAFTELNLHRVSLGVYAYNERAIRSYEKVGFVHEGRARQFVQREGRRWDALAMGILRADWERQEAQSEVQE